VSKHVLLTGFEPFGPHKVNPSEMLVKSLEGRLIAGRLIVIRVLPSETRTMHERLETALHDEQPDLLIGVGLAAGRSSLALERLAVNVLDFEMADAVGVQKKDDMVSRGGPDARIATIPLNEIVDNWKAAGVPGYISNSAGTYLCNQWLYEALTLASVAAPPIPVGFLHVPLLPGQAMEAGAEKTSSMALDTMRRGLESMIETIVPWIESRPHEKLTKSGPSVWIPRGLREVER